MTRAPTWPTAGLYLIVLPAVLVIAVFMGRYPQIGFISPGLLASDSMAVRLIITLRLPRVIAAALVGAVLASGGTALQTVFGNPLVEPGLIGVSQGSAFGATLAIVMGASALWMVQVSAAIVGGLALGLAYWIARRIRYGGWILRLVLSGIAVSAVFSALVGVMKFVADPMRQLPAITFWLLGGLSAISWYQVIYLAIPAVICLGYLWISRWRLNLMSLEDRVAFSLGTAPGRERVLVLCAVTIGTAAAISVSGIVGWVGLLVPHLSRRIVGGDTRRVVPFSMALGAVFVVVGDTLARTVVAGEIPLGVVTALVGAVSFVVLLTRRGINVRK